MHATQVNLVSKLLIWFSFPFRLLHSLLYGQFAVVRLIDPDIKHAAVAHW